MTSEDYEKTFSEALLQGGEVRDLAIKTLKCVLREPAKYDPIMIIAARKVLNQASATNEGSSGLFSYPLKGSSA